MCPQFLNILCPDLPTGTICGVDAALLFSIAACSILALGIAGLSLAIQLKRGAEHPDVSEVRTSVRELHTQYLDLLDKVEHWVKRDRVRRLRDSHDPKDEPAAAAPQDIKANLRARVFGNRAG